MNTQATTPAVENAPIVSSDEQNVQAVLTDENASIKDFVKLANSKLYDLNFVHALEDIADNISTRITPPDADADFNELTTQLAAAKTLDERLKLTLQIQDVVNKSGTQFDEIKKLTANLSDDDFYFAHADRIQKLVESEIVMFLKKNRNAVLKIKRAPKTGDAEPAKEQKAKEYLSFTFKGTDYKDISTAPQGSIKGELVTVSKALNMKTKKEIFAVIKDPAQAKKHGFTNVKAQTIAPPVVATTPDTAEA